MNTIRTIELDEGKTLSLSSAEMSQDLASEIYKSGLLEVSFPAPNTDFQYQLRSTNTVGQIPVGSEVVIRVSPKVPIDNLFQMLEVAYNLKSFRLHDGVVDIESLPDLYERLASILAQRVLDRARKGLYRNYIDEEADLPYVRGRIDIRETTRLINRGMPALHCNYQEHTADLDENRILLWTLRIISRTGLRRPEVAHRVRAAWRVLLGATSVRPVSAQECMKRLYNRLNEDYRPMHGLCRFFLESAGPGIKRGEHDLIPFTVNMPRLFELFVAEWLKAHVPTGLTVAAQHNVILRGTDSLSFQMDIVIADSSDRKSIAVLDTKYKSSTQPAIEDIQQIVAYAVELGVNRAFLIYPSDIGDNTTMQVGPISIRCLTFNLATDLDTIGYELYEQILGAI